MDTDTKEATLGAPEMPKGGRGVPVAIGAVVAVIVVAGAALLWSSESKTNKVPLAATPKPVSVVEAKLSTYRASRTYVGRIDPWVTANVGPQFVSAYVDTVLVRPGAVVKKGEVLATLDCRNANAAAQGIAMQARALDDQQKALSHESTRVAGLLAGGFVSPNEAEQKAALSSAKESELMAQRAKMLGTSLEVNDCVLRAPFDGEVATRTVDPGAFVRPGTPMVSIVDRTTVRMTADVPENDFDIVVPGKVVRIGVYATHQDITGAITRRAPAADAATRTVHVEIDVPDPHKEIPVGTTGELHVDVGEPIPATEVPLSSAAIRDTKATVYVVDGDIAHAHTFITLGEMQGVLYAGPTDIPEGTRIVTEGRALLKDGDRVTAKLEETAATASVPSSAPSVAAGSKP
jgi:membrane fusion protein (multidrug efflux system)